MENDDIRLGHVDFIFVELGRGFLVLFLPKVESDVINWKDSLSQGIIWILHPFWYWWDIDDDECHEANCFAQLVAAGQLKMVSDVLEGTMKVGGIMNPRIVKLLCSMTGVFPLNFPVDPIAELLFHC